MEDNLAKTPEWIGGVFPVPPPGSATAMVRPPLLRPPGIGIAMAVFGLITTLIGTRFPHGWVAVGAEGIATLCDLGCLVYYFMIEYRIARALQVQSDWGEVYTPAGVVWRQFIPFYGLYVLYDWLRAIERHLNWRIGNDSSVGLWVFLIMLAGWFAMINEAYGVFIAQGVAFASFYLLYPRLTLTLALAKPADDRASGNAGTLGLR